MATYDSVLEALTQAPLTAKEVEEKLKDAGHSNKGVSTTLSELKRKGKVTYDTPGGPWRVIDEKGSVVVPEGTTLIEAMLAEITKKPLTLDELRPLFGKSTKTTLQNLARQGKVTNNGRRGGPWRVTNSKAPKATTHAPTTHAPTTHAPTGVQAKLLATLAKRPSTHKQLVATFHRDVSVPLARLKSQGKVINDGPGTPWHLTNARKIKGGSAENSLVAGAKKKPKGALSKTSRSSLATHSERLVDKAFRKGDDPAINMLIERREKHIKKIAALDAAILALVNDD